MEAPTELPRLLSQCCTVYDAIAENSKPYADGKRYWIGMLTHIVDELYGLPRYTRIVNMLKDMGCIEQLRRGAGNLPGEWMLIQRPSLETYRAVKVHNKLRKPRKDDDGISAPNRILDQRIRDLTTALNEATERIEDLERQLEDQAV